MNRVAMMISIRPKECAKTLNGYKTIEIRKDAPKDWKDYIFGKAKKKPKPRTAYIYCTKGGKHECLTKANDTTFAVGGLFCAQSPRNGKVVGKFTLKEVERIMVDGPWEECCYYTKTCYEDDLLRRSCLMGLEGYLQGCEGYAYYFSDLVVFDKPKELWEFGIMCAPQSWQYVIYPYGFSVGEKVKIVPQCAEYHGNEDKVYEVLGEPKCIGERHCTPICYNGINQYFATEYLTYAEAKE